MGEMVELKPCPFCGDSDLRDEPSDVSDAHEVSCNNCGGMMWAMSKAQAHNDWNARAAGDGQDQPKMRS
jgi:Lar family restriction alleviation protein